MPTVRNYSTRQVETAALPTVRRTAAATAETFGASGGAAISKVGISIYEDEMLKQDQIATLEADRKLAEFENRFLYDPKNGALTKRGKDAFGLPDVAEKEFKSQVDEVRKGLTTERQRVAFDRAVMARQKDINATLSRHVMTEIRRHDEAESTSGLVASRQSAVDNFRDEARIQTEVERQRAIVVDYAARNGLGPEYVKAKLGEQIGETHAAVIQRMLANGNDQSAKQYYDKFKGDITDGRVATEIEGKLKTAVTEGEGMRSADDAWSRLGPKRDGDPVNLDVMLDDIKSRHADNPSVLKAATQQLKERAAVHNSSQRERAEAQAGAVWRAVSNGASLNAVRTMPEYLALPGQAQEQIRQHVVADAFQRSQRGRTLANQAEEDAGKRNFAAYLKYSNADTLANMSEDQVIALLPQLGRQLTGSLMARKQSMVKSEDTVRDASIDDALFNTVAERAGLDPFDKKKNDNDRAQLGRLKHAVLNEIAAQQASLRRRLHRPEKEKLMQEIVDRKVIVDRWGPDAGPVPAAVVSPDDRSKTYVPIDKMPAQVRTEYLNWLRSTGRISQGVPDKVATDRFRARIERAYGARLTGAPREDIEKILKGE